MLLRTVSLKRIVSCVTCANLAAQRGKREVAHIVAVDQDAARSHVEEARNQVDQRRFARAARPHQRQHFAGAHLEIDVVQNLVLALFGASRRSPHFQTGSTC